MAFVVIQHIEPAHESQMAGILAKCTDMTVVQAADGMRVEANCCLYDSRQQVLVYPRRPAVIDGTAGAARHADGN